MSGEWTGGAVKLTPRQKQQLAAWRKALAANAKTRRNRRGRRQQAITGIRVDPGRQP